MHRQLVVSFVTASLLLASRHRPAGVEPPDSDVARPGAIFNALDHGVSPSAVDNSAAIQEAIDACQKAGGGIVQLPAGVFRVTGTLVMASNHVWLRGAGRAASTLFFDNGGADCIVVGNRLPTKAPVASSELRSNKITDLNMVFGTKTAGRTVAIINHFDLGAVRFATGIFMLLEVIPSARLCGSELLGGHGVGPDIADRPRR